MKNKEQKKKVYDTQLDSSIMAVILTSLLLMKPVQAIAWNNFVCEFYHFFVSSTVLSVDNWDSHACMFIVIVTV